MNMEQLYPASANHIYAHVLDFQAPYTATAIELLEEAGVIMGGKANMDEFGMG
jgi:Asp-tRNA(Asn)/Glu-tRNA(Gln) amidotransferase A subunit family amidase